MKITLIPVAPIGQHTTFAFVNPGGMREVTMQDYPPSERGAGLLHLRLGCDLGLRECARAVGLSPVDISALEHGRATLSADDWCALFVAIGAAWREKNPPAPLPSAGAP